VSAATLGSFALWSAIAIGLSSLIPRLSPLTARRLLTLSALFAVGSTVVLAVALLVGDFSLVYVTDTTSRATPWAYRLSALWGGMDGSMLFYATLTLSVGVFGLHRARAGRVVVGVVAVISIGLLSLAATIAYPFEVLDISAVDGDGLLAILQHPAMVYHPPILYLGLTTLVLPFALTVEAAVAGQIDRDWIKSTRRWLVVSWVFLTLGMATGANWAYVELGWGGFWAWDPVENTALMPWLAITVFLHTSRIQQRDGRLRRWNVFFALVPFVLTVVGIYLTRSGVTGSIHAFAENPVIGRVLLSAAVVIGIGAVVLSIRSTRGEPWMQLEIWRDTWLMTSGGLLSAILVFVTVGSIYPAYAQVFLDETLTVGAGFFITTVYPISLIVAVLVGFAHRTKWNELGVSGRDMGTFALVVVATLAWPILVVESSTFTSAALLAISVGGLVLIMRDIVRARPSRRLLAGYLAHMGVAMVLIGVAGSAMGDEVSATMAPGDTVEVGGQNITLLTIDTGETDRYVYARAEFEVDGAHVLSPEIRAYENQRLPVAEPALRSTLSGDVIIAISLLFPGATSVDVTVLVRPMVLWVWIGALTIVAAGLLLLVSTTGDVARRRRVATAEQLPTETTNGTSLS
jgi:cytochrome c-type biogenesis protein CcmF